MSSDESEESSIVGVGSNSRATHLLYQLIEMEKDGVPLTPNEQAALEHLRETNNMPPAIGGSENEDDDSSLDDSSPDVEKGPCVTRDDLLEQLRLAKELRSRLEESAARVEMVKRLEPEFVRDNGKHILNDAKGDFLELAALQDAVDGGFALPRYDHYKRRRIEKQKNG